MTKLTSKFLLAGAVAALALAVSAAPSDAARKRAAPAPKSCTTAALYCSTNCSGGWCQVYVCGVDGKYTPAILHPVCAQGLCINVQKKC